MLIFQGPALAQDRPAYKDARLPVDARVADLLILRRAIWPLREALGYLMREGVPVMTDSTRPYLRDCYDHVVQIVELVETYRELTADLRDLYMSSISNRINETMRVLTIISVIFIPLTFIAVAIIYLGGEIVRAVSEDDQVSQMAHLLGGATGAVFGFLSAKSAKPEPAKPTDVLKAAKKLP